MAYELAFHPTRLNAVWNDWERGAIPDLAVLRSILTWALTLHQRLSGGPCGGWLATRQLPEYTGCRQCWGASASAWAGPNRYPRKSRPGWCATSACLCLAGWPRRRRKDRIRPRLLLVLWPFSAFHPPQSCSRGRVCFPWPVKSPRTSRGSLSECQLFSVSAFALSTLNSQTINHPRSVVP